jgi:uncharacterized protein YggU (UPF0235/DUF167 family)
MRLELHVKPLSRETRPLSESDGTLVMNVGVSPSKGKANREIVKWISKKLQIPSNQVQITSGLRSKWKIIEIFGINEI